MTTFRTLLTVLAVSLLLLGSPASAHDEVGSTTSALLGVSDSFWPEAAIPICFETDEHADLQAELRRVLDTSWSFFSDVSFTGFGPCSPRTDAVRVLLADEPARVAAPGRFVAGIEAGVVLNPTFENLDGPFLDSGYRCTDDDRLRCFDIQATSVFGYVLGFVPHSFNGQPVEQCVLFDEWSGTADRLLSIPTSSRLDYCITGSDSGFSVEDVHALRAVYGPWETDVAIAVDVAWSVTVHDDEIGKDETASEAGAETFMFGLRGDFSIERSRIYGISGSTCAGDEARADYEWTLYQSMPGERPLVTLEAALFEGTSCGTKDLEDRAVISGVLERGEPEQLTIGLENSGFGGGDHATVSFAATYNYVETLKVDCPICEQLVRSQEERQGQQGAENSYDSSIDPDLSVDLDLDLEPDLGFGW